jgi:uncharacterized lipoprotein YddW (UPF0748 family)
VKPLSGHVLFPSKVAPPLREWRGFTYPAGYDLLQTTLEEGRRRGLRIYANINVFSNGHKLVRSGPLYENPEGGSIIYEVERTFTTPRGDQKTVDMGVNRPPGPDGISVYEPSNTRRPLAEGEVAALVAQDQVVAIQTPANTPPEGILVPPGSYLLLARGASARWLPQGLLPGDTLTWTAQDRLLPILEAPSETVAAFVNPSDPAPRAYLLRLVEELVTRYPLDGIVFDRMRYAGLQSDFSPLAREQFEAYLGRKLTRFPGEIYSFDPVPGRPLVWGPYFRQWLEWRARTIRTWLEAASALAREKRPGIKVGVYVGSWYPSYYTVGVNWGSEEFAPGYDWMTPTYPSTGYAALVDWISTGCYHPIATRAQARAAGLDESFTVQAAGEISSRAVGDMAFVYAGIYLLDYRGAPEAFREALRAARDSSNGVMLFDLSQLEEYGWWPILEQEFPEPRTAPHDVLELLPAVRELRRSLSAGARNSLS